MLLFEYAKLQKSGVGTAASTPGVLRKRGNDAAARFNDKNSTLVHGKVLDLAEAELRRLDTEERPQYSRVAIRLSDGRKAYAYEYMHPDWSDMPVIESGTWNAKRG